MTTPTDQNPAGDGECWQAQIVQMRADSARYEAEREKAAQDAKRIPVVAVAAISIYVALMLAAGAWLGHFLPR